MLEDFLNTFVGIVITVSHDAISWITSWTASLNSTETEIFCSTRAATPITSKQRTPFRRKCGRNGKSSAVQNVRDEPAKSKNNDWKQNRPTRLKFTFKEQREYETIDDDIAALEEKIASLDDQMLKNATNSAKLAELMAEKERTEAALEEKTERWVYLTDLAEQIEAQNQK